ncbi:MAG: radical SAM protein [Patescibacteria group bacterium]|jgi:MoaA/NifB/PqqE/SkfB family radical SAM enzyme
MESKQKKGISFFDRFKKSSQIFAMKQIVKILPLLSKKNLVTLLDLYEKIAKGENKKVVAGVKNMLETTPAGDMIVRGLKLVNPNCRNKIATTLIADGLLMRDEKRKKIEAEGGTVPFTVLISPTMRCNLKCTGCYAYNYSKEDDLSYEVLDRVVTEAEEMGVAFITMLGGEPLMLEDLFKLFETHQDMYFQFYSNGTLMTEEVAKKLAKLGNVAVMLSIEGFKKETDARRGEGIYERVLKAMDILKAEGVPFGFSTAITSLNESVIASDEFIDMMIEKGALIGWFFLYMPVGKDPDLSLMPTPEQRINLLEFDKHIRATKQLFIVDFWNDAPFVGGCIAAKFYIHITSNGDVEPCIFTHLAQDNIKDKSLREVMESEYFKKLRSMQPYDENLYLPCQWIDHPEVSRKLSQELNLKVTHPGADDILVREDLKEGIDKYSARVHELYAQKWQDDFHGVPPGTKSSEAKKEEV